MNGLKLTHDQAILLLSLFKAQHSEMFVEDLINMKGDYKIKDLVIEVVNEETVFEYASLMTPSLDIVLCYSTFSEGFFLKKRGRMSEDGLTVSVTWERIDIMKYINLKDNV